MLAFKLKVQELLMEEFDYPGIRVMLEATLDRMRQPIKIDISTDDVITPKAVEYDYKLMFEDRTISVLTYNKETLLAEKMQTIINRGIANTRLRDYYDVYSCQTAHCGRRKPHFDFGGNTSPIVPYRHLPQTLRGLTADCRSLV